MEIIDDKYRIEKDRVGTGGFSEVFLGTNLTNKQNVAIKILSLEQKKNIIDKIKIEVEIMQKFNHPNIVTYYDISKTNLNWYIIMEYCNGGTLEDVIKYNEIESKNSLNFNREANTYYYLSQLKNALKYIRDQGYIHRDIKPMNVLLVRQEQNISDSFSEIDTLFKSDDLTKSQEKIYIANYNFTEKLIVKLADFGLAKNYKQNEEIMMNTICGSPLYMAPELLIDNNYNSKADLWSFGVIMYEMLYGNNPHAATNLAQLKKYLQNKEINFHFGKNFTKYCFDILTKLLSKNPKNRLDWSYFFKHEWFIYWNERCGKENDLTVNNIFVNAISCNTIPCSTIPCSTIPSVQKNTIKEIGSSNSYPLGYSNLSKMKLNISSGYINCLKYPSSYPPIATNHVNIGCNPYQNSIKNANICSQSIGNDNNSSLNNSVVKSDIDKSIDSHSRFFKNLKNNKTDNFEHLQKNLENKTKPIQIPQNKF